MLEHEWMNEWMEQNGNRFEQQQQQAKNSANVQMSRHVWTAREMVQGNNGEWLNACVVAMMIYCMYIHTCSTGSSGWRGNENIIIIKGWRGFRARMHSAQLVESNGNKRRFQHSNRREDLFARSVNLVNSGRWFCGSRSRDLKFRILEFSRNRRFSSFQIEFKKKFERWKIFE